MCNKFFKNVGNYTSFPGCFPKLFQNTLFQKNRVPSVTKHKATKKETLHRFHVNPFPNILRMSIFLD